MYQRRTFCQRQEVGSSGAFLSDYIFCSFRNWLEGWGPPQDTPCQWVGVWCHHWSGRPEKHAARQVSMHRPRLMQFFLWLNTVFFSKQVWSLITMIMISVVYSCGCVSELTLLPTYEWAFVDISVSVSGCHFGIVFCLNRSCWISWLFSCISTLASYTVTLVKETPAESSAMTPLCTTDYGVNEGKQHAPSGIVMDCWQATWNTRKLFRCPTYGLWATLGIVWNARAHA